MASRGEAQSAAAAAAQAAQTNQAQREAPDVRLQAPLGSDYQQHALPRESPCFQLHRLLLEGPRVDAFGFVQHDLNRYAGRCVGQQGLKLIVRRATDLMLAKGYVTTRLAVPEQNVSTGVLRLVLVPGLVGSIRFAPGSPAIFWKNALPLRPGDVLDLRDVEQGLEQLKRVPSQEVTIDIAPGGTAGSSDLVLTVKRHKRWRVSVGLDDGGADVTGKEQGQLNVSLDHPLGLNDLLVVGYSHNATHARDRGAHGVNFDYSIPWQRWTFDLSSWDSAYRQPASGGGGDFVLAARRARRGRAGRICCTGIVVARLRCRRACSGMLRAAISMAKTLPCSTGKSGRWNWRCWTGAISGRGSWICAWPTGEGFPGSAGNGRRRGLRWRLGRVFGISWLASMPA